MHAEMYRNEDVIEGEEVDLLRPAADRLVTAGHQLRIEERVEAVHFRHVVLTATFHQQVHVEVYHLECSDQHIMYHSINRMREYLFYRTLCLNKTDPKHFCKVLTKLLVVEV